MSQTWTIDDEKATWRIFMETIHHLPVSFIQNYYLVSSRRQRNFLLGKHLYFISHNINPSGKNSKKYERKQQKVTSIKQVNTLPIV